MSRINWRKVELDYIKGTVSYRDIAKKYKISTRQVSDRGKKENWVEKRNKFRDETYSEALARARVTEVDNLKRINGLTEKMISQLEEALADASQFKKYIVSKTIYKDGVPVEDEMTEREFTKFDAKSVKNLTSALKDLASITKSITEDKDGDNEILVKFISDDKEDGMEEWNL